MIGVEHHIAPEDRMLADLDSHRRPGNVEVAGVMDAQGGRFYVHKPEWTLSPDTRKGDLLPKSEAIELMGVNDAMM